jgi:hypothetical protein
MTDKKGRFWVWDFKMGMGNKDWSAGVMRNEPECWNQKIKTPP